VIDRRPAGSSIRNRSGLEPESRAGSGGQLDGGIVLRPGSFLEGLQLSVDYYSITIDEAIGHTRRPDGRHRCFQGATEFCPLVTRDPVTGDIIQIRNVL